MEAYDSASRLAAWDDELEAIYERLSGRGSFRYDAAADPLYAGYVDRARVAGGLAMRDAMGRAAALTGGYGSSYAQSVAQRGYDDYLRSLSEAMPQFYSMALQRWQDEGEALADRYGLLERRASDERERQSEAAAAAAAAEKTAWQRQQSSYKALVQLIQGSGYRPTDAELEAAGLSRAAAEALLGAWERAQQPTRRSGGGGSRKKKTGTDEEGAPSAAPAVTAASRAAAGGGGRRVAMTR